ncbi:MAG TPA: ribonuclease HIII [Terrimicrobiaceae bacterium]
MPDKAITLYNTPLTPAQAAKLKLLLREEGYKFESRPYTLYFAQKDKLTIAVYEKGPKVVIQGRGTEDFVKFRLEPDILGEAKLGYEEILNPEMFEPHFGIDESGKGDFFGPLVIAGAYIDRDLARHFQEIGVADSKRISSDRRIRDLAAAIRKSGAAQSVVVIGPDRYNALFVKIGNLNKLLAWGHARVIENLCALRPECPRALSDKFADVRVLQRALMEKGRSITLDQRTKAESDFAVAAASILAREKFIDWLDTAGRRLGVPLPRGVSASVKEAAKKIVANGGREALDAVAKMHFKTAAEVLASS